MKNGILPENVKKMFDKCVSDYKRAHTSYTGYNYCKNRYTNYSNKKKDDATHILSILY